MSFSPTYDTTSPGASVGNREDLSSTVAFLAPEETPVYSSATKKKATGMYHEWLLDGLAAPDTTAVLEGQDVGVFVDKFANRARAGNRIQHLRRAFGVTNEQQAVESVGPAQVAQAEGKSVRELKRDIEATLCSTNDRTAGDGAQASAMRGLDKWISSTGPSDLVSTYRTPAGSIYASTAFSETVFNNLITSIYRVSGKAESLLCVADTAVRRAITDFARLSASTDYSVRKVQYPGGEGVIKLSVTQYESDHGIVSIVNMNPDCAPDTTNKDTAYILNPDFYAVAELVGMGSKMLPDLGGGPRGFVDWYGTLEVNHPGAHGKITQIA